MRTNSVKVLGRDLNPRSLSGLGADAANLWITSPAEFYYEDMDDQP